MTSHDFHSRATAAEDDGTCSFAAQSVSKLPGSELVAVLLWFHMRELT